MPLALQASGAALLRDGAPVDLPPSDRTDSLSGKPLWLQASALLRDRPPADRTDSLSGKPLALHASWSASLAPSATDPRSEPAPREKPLSLQSSPCCSPVCNMSVSLAASNMSASVTSSLSPFWDSSPQPERAKASDIASPSPDSDAEALAFAFATAPPGAAVGSAVAAPACASLRARALRSYSSCASCRRVISTSRATPERASSHSKSSGPLLQFPRSNGASAAVPLEEPLEAPLDAARLFAFITAPQPLE